MSATHPDFTDLAAQAIRAGRLHPGEVDDRPVRGLVRMPVAFKIF